MFDLSRSSAISPESCIETDRESRRALIDGMTGKIVLAKIDSRVIVAFGGWMSRHIEILERATKELLNRSILDQHSKPAPGVIVGGAMFFHQSQQIKGESEMLGKLPDGVFNEPTVDVLQRWIRSVRSEGN